ncbi:hypothetical protein ACFMQL_20325 [Nonomuraea fastidiosa]|uniref:hypothetical protein n=1 Tax=Nonomuraea fastidiosa TaxID=46173 RepID=UPI00366A987B
MSSTTAEQAITRALRRKAKPTAETIIRELHDAGYVITGPDSGDAPAWLPKSQLAWQAVRQVADLVNQGLTIDEIMAETGKCRRMIDRYVAAAFHYGWATRRPQRKARS